MNNPSKIIPTTALLPDGKVPAQIAVSPTKQKDADRIERAKKATRQKTKRLKKLFDTKSPGEIDLDLDEFYRSRMRRRTQFSNEISDSLLSAGITPEPILEEAVGPSPLRGLLMTLSPGEEYENYRKLDAAINKVESSPFGFIPSQTIDGEPGAVIEDNSEQDKPIAQDPNAPTATSENKGATEAMSMMTSAKQSRTSTITAITQSLYTQQNVPGSSYIIKFTAIGMINPLGRFRLFWDIMSICFIFYNAIVLPFNASFNTASVDDTFDSFLDAFFLVDILVTFNTAIVRDGSIRYDRKAVAKRYIRTWLLIDLIAALPYGYMFPSNDSSNENIRKSLKLLRLIRLLRLFRISRIMSRIQNAVFIRSTMSALIKYLLVVIFVSHWFSCIFHAIGASQTGESWIKVQKLDGPDSNEWDRYVAALYFAVMSIATIGYGDVSASNADERLFSIFAMIIGAGVFAYGITNIVELVSSLTIQETRFREKMDEVNEYMSARELPMKLRVEIREFYHNTRQSRESKLNAEHQILNDLSSKLRSKIALSINDQFLRKFPFFTGSDPNFLMELALNMRMIHFAPLEDVIVEGEIGHEMFFIFRGAVEVRKKDIQIGILGQNQYFGEMAILSPDNRRTATVRTLCFCELRMLSRNRFLEALAIFPAMQTKIAQVARKRELPSSSNPLHPAALISSSGKGPGTTTIGSAATKVSLISKDSNESTNLHLSVLPQLPQASLNRMKQASQRHIDPFLSSTRLATAGRLVNSAHRTASAGTQGITPSMAIMITDTLALLEEANRRQEALVNRVLQLKQDLDKLAPQDQFD